jgi:MFS transporter, AAHS family, 3-hydroxyphenylpropionic acid transporter
MRGRANGLQTSSMSSEGRVVGAAAPNVNATVALCLLCAVLEGFDIQAMGVAAPRLIPEFGLSPDQMGWVFSISNIGLVLGAAFGGWLADRVGRKPVFIGAVATFGVFTLGVALAHSFSVLFLLRFIAGVGFGGALPNMMAMATEMSAPGKRAQTAAIMFCGMPIGGGLSAVVTQVLPPDTDWRALFVVGGVLPMLLVPVLWLYMTETMRPAAQMTKRHSTLHILFGEGRAWPSVLLWAAFLPTVLVLYLILNWLPTLVVAKGFARAAAPQVAITFNFVAVAGAILFARLVDKFGTRAPLVVAYLGLIGTLVALGAATNLSVIVFLSGMVGFFLLGANYALYGVAGSYYPLEMRGTGSGASVAMSRVGSIVGPLLGGVLLGGGATATNVVQSMAPFAAAAGVAVVILSFFPRAE